MLKYFYVILEIYYVLTFITLGVKYLNIICLFSESLNSLGKLHKYFSLYNI